MAPGQKEKQRGGHPALPMTYIYILIGGWVGKEKIYSRNETSLPEREDFCPAVRMWNQGGLLLWHLATWRAVSKISSASCILLPSCPICRPVVSHLLFSMLEASCGWGLFPIFTRKGICPKNFSTTVLLLKICPFIWQYFFVFKYLHSGYGICLTTMLYIRSIQKDVFHSLKAWILYF